MSKYIFDIEANGLYNEVTKIHCIVIMDKDTKEIETFDTKSGILNAINTLYRAEQIIGHNIAGYDIRVIEKLYPQFKFDLNRVRDTLVRSWLSNPHRGKHSLEAFGEKFGIPKVQNEDWATYTPHMLKRCIEDVKINNKVDKLLEEEMEGWDWSRSEKIETHFSYILSEQESNGWLLDVEKINHYIDEIGNKVDSIDKKILPEIPPTVVRYENVTKVYRADGLMTCAADKWFSNTPFISTHSFGKEFCKVEFKEINLASTSQVKKYLLSVGWIPTEWNYKKDPNNKKKLLEDEYGKKVKSSPKLTEDSFESISSGVGKYITQRITLCHRRSQMQGWLNNIRDDGRIGAGGYSNGTNTGRVRHTTVVNVPKAKASVLYGREMRSVFIATNGYKLVGADLSALENRIAAHFTYPYDNGEFAERVLKGDPHKYIANLFGCSRDAGKAVNYAMMYGAGFGKIKTMLECSDEEANGYLKMWWDANSSLQTLKDRLEGSLISRGENKKKELSHKAYIKGIDGRKIYVRSWHSVMNSLFQNAGSVINKITTILSYKKIIAEGIDAKFVGNYHDEVQLEVLEKDVDKCSSIVLNCMQEAGKMLNLNIPIEGEAKVGNNWCETH